MDNNSCNINGVIIVNKIIRKMSRVVAMLLLCLVVQGGSSLIALEAALRIGERAAQGIGDGMKAVGRITADVIQEQIDAENRRIDAAERGVATEEGNIARLEQAGNDFAGLAEAQARLAKHKRDVGAAEADKAKWAAQKQAAAAAAADITKKGAEGLMRMAEERAARGTAVEAARVSAKEAGEAQAMEGIEKTKQWIDLLSDKKKLKVLAAVTIGTVLISYLGYHGIKLGARYAEKYLDSPTLVRESSVPSFKERVKKLLFSRQKSVSRMGEIIVASEIMEQLEDIARETRDAKVHNDNLMNVMFHGPPGTGKTMFAKELARNSGLDFAMMSGADFSQFAEGKDVQELHKLFDWAETSKKGLLIFIDEAEVFLANRSLDTTTERSKKLTDAFLSRVEKPTSKNLMFVFATNHLRVIDSAVRSRVALQIKFVLPTQVERERILSLYLNKLTDGTDIGVAEEVMQAIPRFAAQLEGFSPRQIETIVELMVKKARYREDCKISVDDAQKVVSWKRAEFADQAAAAAA